MIIVGAGLLGTALARYRGFAEQGFRLVGMFDSSATVIGARFGSGRVRGIDELDEFCRKEQVDIAMVTVPAGEAESTVERLGGAGVKAILNFAPVKVHAPEGVLVRQVDLSSELMSCRSIWTRGCPGSKPEVNAAAVPAGLTAAGAAFGPPAAGRPPFAGACCSPRSTAATTAFARAIELIYEGYLFHYRESRVTPAAGDRETALLAGDCFYARGLRVIAARGDADAVGLLARLMAACSYLRSVGAPFAADDALWAYDHGGARGAAPGADPRRWAGLFDQVDDGLANGAAMDVAGLARPPRSACRCATRRRCSLNSTRWPPRGASRPSPRRRG